MLRPLLLLCLTAALASAQDLEARRVTEPPVIDGRTDDVAWVAVPMSSAFTVFRPTEGAAPSFRTEVRAVYDDRTLFVLVRAYDPQPDSIIGLLARRDNVNPPNDQIQLYIDSYHDGRTGFGYIVNPVGVKADFLLFDDDRLDLSWDGVWDVATRVDSLGWVAEFAIPFSQLRFRGGEKRSFGFMVWRRVGRLGEQLSLPQYRPSRSGLVSQFGTLTGINNLASRVRLEAAPYALARGRNVPRPGLPTSTRTDFAGGADVKFGPSPNVTLDATLNPDFGQVESDPAILNLTSFETFLPERRPFFLEGVGLFRFTLSRDPNSNEQLFYTRRIGRRPSLYDSYADAETPTETTILGAGKLTARIGQRTSVASLAAVTAPEHGKPAPGGGAYLVEPRTLYSVNRVQREFRQGRSGIGVMLTGVDRQLDDVTDDVLARQALTAGVLTQHQSRDGQYWARAWAVGSHITGTTAAMTRTQLSLVHAFQRPDDHIALDTTLTSMSGAGGQLWLGKTGGVVRYGTSYRYFSPSFDPTDIGFINEANHKSWVLDFGLQSTRSTRWYRNAGIQTVHIAWWSGSGRIDERVETTANVELPTQWRLSLNVQNSQLFDPVCSQKCTRGGPALRKEPFTSVGVQVGGDQRRVVIPDIGARWTRDDGGRTSILAYVAGVQVRARSNLQIALSTQGEDLRNDAQFYRRFGAAASDTTHYTVARLDQATRSLTLRMAYAATPRVSIEWYAQPFLAKGDFSNVRELAQPRSPNYDARFKPYFDTAITGAPGGVDFRQFRSNLVTRWEYRPGSVLFFVWSQGRDLFSNAAGTLDLQRDARDLFALPPHNTIALKASYWYAR